MPWKKKTIPSVSRASVGANRSSVAMSDRMRSSFLVCWRGDYGLGFRAGQRGVGGDGAIPAAVGPDDRQSIAARHLERRQIRERVREDVVSRVIAGLGL